MSLLAKLAREKVTVALTGNGGDELFGGYERYRLAHLAHHYKNLPKFIKSLTNQLGSFSKLDYTEDVDLFARFMFLKDDVLEDVVSPSLLQKQELSRTYFKDRYFSDSKEDVTSTLMEADRKSWLPDYFFLLSDKMSMAHGLEERVPLVSNALVDFSQSLPSSFKVDAWGTKKILKDAFKKDLPSYLFNQPKRGWFAPGAKWFREKNFEQFVREVFSPEYYAGTAKLFNYENLEKMLDQHINKEQYNLTILWAILTFQTWAKTYKVHI